MGGSEISRLPFLQDYQLSEARFRACLQGEVVDGLLDQKWAVQRLIEEAPYADIMRLLDLHTLVTNWPRWRKWITSKPRRRGFDFLTAYLQINYPETYGTPDHG